MVREKPTWPGARIRKKGEGMPNYNNNNLFGTLYITFDVEFPKGEFNTEDKESKWMSFSDLLSSSLPFFLFFLLNNFLSG